MFDYPHSHGDISLLEAHTGPPNCCLWDFHCPVHSVPISDSPEIVVSDPESCRPVDKLGVV